MRYSIKIEIDALQDIQNATDWYNKQLQGLGTKFQKQVILQINSLKNRPKFYAIRYRAVRCLVVKKFPFLIHYTIDEDLKRVEIFAIYHTSRNPEIWDLRS